MLPVRVLWLAAALAGLFSVWQLHDPLTTQQPGTPRRAPPSLLIVVALAVGLAIGLVGRKKGKRRGKKKREMKSKKKYIKKMR